MRTLEAVQVLNNFRTIKLIGVVMEDGWLIQTCVSRTYKSLHEERNTTESLRYLNILVCICAIMQYFMLIFKGILKKA